MQSSTENFFALESAPAEQVLHILTREVAELVHVVGLLVEELRTLGSQGDSVATTDLNTLIHYIQDELGRVHPYLSVAMVNRAIIDSALIFPDDPQSGILVLRESDSVGTVVGLAVDAGQAVPLIGRHHRQETLVLRARLEVGQSVVLRDLAEGDALVKYGVLLRQAARAYQAGEACSLAP
ncbi:MAG: hypothetical protein HC915_12330 [Anaerolineae bacterium]|nr:hypothetical protein [Anaerolineae bacterium]